MAVALVLVHPAVTQAAFTGVATNAANAFATDTLDPPGALALTRTCRTAPTQVAAATANGGSVSTLAIPRPAPTVATDLLVVVGVSGDADGQAPTPPSGWTTLDIVENDHDDFGSAVYWRFAGTSTGPYTFSGFGSDPAVLLLGVYRGVDPTVPIDVHAAADYGSTATGTAPSVSTVSAPSTLLSAITVSGITSLDVPSGFSSVVQTSATEFSNRIVGGLFRRTLSTTGSTGTATVALGSSNTVHGFTLALRAESVATDTVSVGWTATPDGYADGYEVSWTGGAAGSATVSGSGSVAYDHAATSTAAAYSYSVRSRYGAWSSSAVTGSIAAC